MAEDKQVEILRLATVASYEVLNTAAEEPFDRIVRLAAAALKMPMAAIGLFDRDRVWLKSKLGLPFKEMPRTNAFCDPAGGACVAVPDAAADPRFRDNPYVAGEPHLRCFFSAPLISPGNRVIGLLFVMDREPRTLGPDQTGILESLARLAVDELELRLIAEFDALTGALSRRNLLECAKRDISRARRYGEHLTCAVVDLDHLKDVNETYGYAAGDRVLQQVVAGFREKLRTEDYIGRLGGEEFVVLMPMTGPRDAFFVADRLRESVLNGDYPVGDGDIGLTASVGFATWTKEQPNIAALLTAAIRSLAEAKAAGCNCTVGSQSAAVPAAS
jgi:diguanylate cyclase (GGDEF)-like protein